MTIDGHNVEPNTVRYIQLLKSLEADTDEPTGDDPRPAQLLASALPPSEPPPVRPPPTVEDEDECDSAICIYRALASQPRSAGAGESAAVAPGVRLMRRQAV